MNSLSLMAEENLKGIERVVCFASGKGGVGKSVLCSASALMLVPRSVGLLDLDIHGSSVPLIFGVKGVPREEKGLLPLETRGIKVFSMGFMFDSCPLLGSEISETIREIFAIVKWGKLDFLLIDMPPGMGEEILEILPFRPQFVVVTTPSPIAWEVARKLVHLLRRARAQILGVIENMCMNEPRLRDKVLQLGLKHSWVRFDPQLDESFGEKFPPPQLSEDVNRTLGELGIC
jgi:ATP-binding protein involved in chromosome partitioning